MPKTHDRSIQLATDLALPLEAVTGNARYQNLRNSCPWHRHPLSRSTCAPYRWPPAWQSRRSTAANTVATLSPGPNGVGVQRVSWIIGIIHELPTRCCTAPAASLLLDGRHRRSGRWPMAAAIHPPALASCSTAAPHRRAARRRPQRERVRA